MVEWVDVGDILPAHLHASTDGPYTRSPGPRGILVPSDQAQSRTCYPCRDVGGTMGMLEARTWSLGWGLGSS